MFVSRAHLSAALCRGDQVLWRESRPMDGDFETALTGLLRTAKQRGALYGTIAYGPAYARVKRLASVASNVTSQRLVRELVTSNAQRFFPIAGQHQVQSAARIGTDWWAASLDASLIERVEIGCAAAGIRIDRHIPAIAAMAQLSGDETVECSDDALTDRLVRNGSVWVSLRRSPTGQSHASSDEALRGADAAARCRSDAPLSTLSQRKKRQALRYAFWTRAALVAWLVVSGTIAMVAPGLAASVSLRRDRLRLAAVADSAAEWMQQTAQWRETAAAIVKVRQFEAARPSFTAILAGISRALPDSSALLSLQVDSTRAGSMMVLSTSAASALPRLGAVPELVEPRVASAVSRENDDGVLLQRMAVRFRVAGSMGGFRRR